MSMFLETSPGSHRKVTMPSSLVKVLKQEDLELPHVGRDIWYQQLRHFVDNLKIVLKRVMLAAMDVLGQNYSLVVPDPLKEH